VTQLARRVATTLLRSATINRAVRALARVRGHRLVLVYHRLGPSAPNGCEVVPSVPVDLFRAQLQAVGELYDLVTLDEILLEDRSPRLAVSRERRAAVALTFDDDLPSHAEHALPVLRELGVPATFFLSGRALHGLGAYWFQQLEALLIAYGERRAAALLHLPERQARELVLACEGDADLRRRVNDVAAGLAIPGILGRDAIAALAAGGMTIGFHTVDHDILPRLTGAALDDAVSHGREDLAAATGAAVHYFAYPHGKADTQSAAAVRRAGFNAAFTGLPKPVRNGDDRHRLGRWEPGPLGVEDLLVNIVVRLHRTAPVREREYGNR
jgi:peptidoglycan/xylan/chitin deacetylase (PgdA/CDA1 family)